MANTSASIYHVLCRLLHLRQSYRPLPLWFRLPSRWNPPVSLPGDQTTATALPSIRIANPAAVKCRAQSQNAGRKKSAWVCAKWQNYILKESGESIPALVGCFTVGNWTVSNRHGAVLFLNLKTLKCPYLYASANSGNTAVWLKCKRVNNIRTVEVEVQQEVDRPCSFWRLKEFEQRKNMASFLCWFGFGTFLVMNALDDGRKVETFPLMKQMWWMTHFCL